MLNLFLNLPWINRFVQIQIMLINLKWICPMIRLVLVCCEACCDGQCQLYHICHHEFGMDMVVQYLSALDINALPLDLVVKKWIGLRQNSKSYGRFGYFIWTWTLKRLNGLPTAISPQISTQHWRKKLSQRLFAQGSGCSRVPDEVKMSVPWV